MGSSKHHSGNGGINQDNSNAEPLICCLCHEPYVPPDHFAVLIEGIPPICESCINKFNIMDYKDKYREVTFWIAFHHSSWLNQIYDNLIQHHRVESMKGIVWPIQWFIHDYVSKWNLVFVFPSALPWVPDHMEVLRAWKQSISPPSWRGKEGGSVGWLMDHTIHWDTPINANRSNSNYVFIIFHFTQLFMVKAWIDKHFSLLRRNDRILVLSCECR